MGAGGLGHGVLWLRVRVLSAGPRCVVDACGYGAFKHYFILILLFSFLLLIMFIVVLVVVVTFISDYF